MSEGQTIPWSSSQGHKSIPNLWEKVLLPEVGHWTEQDAPIEVNRRCWIFWLAWTEQRQRIEDCGT
jgi:hypothetical protein